MYLDIGRLSREGQKQARALGKLQHRLELCESILVEELNMFEKTIDMLDVTILHKCGYLCNR